MLFVIKILHNYYNVSNEEASTSQLFNGKLLNGHAFGSYDILNNGLDWSVEVESI